MLMSNDKITLVFKDPEQVNPVKFDKALVQDVDGFFAIAVFWGDDWIDEASLTYASGVTLYPSRIAIPFLNHLTKANEPGKMGDNS